jgi:ketosteroid isomerase-like protein
MRASQGTIDMLNEYYAAIEANDPDCFGKFYAEDMTLTFANAPQTIGRTAAVTAFSGILDLVQSLHHDLVNVWEEDDGVVIYEVVGTWTLRDGTKIQVNAVSVATVVDGQFTDQRITVDNSAVFAALAA